MKKYIIPGIIVAVLATAFTIERHLPNEETESMEDYSWLVGHWKGDGFGGESEEIWTEPVDGTMMGMYRHYKDGKVVFYEFMLMSRDGLKLKHFNPDITAWETKEDFVHFKPVGIEEGLIRFKGLEFEQKDANNMEIRLKMNRGGEISTEVFTMSRVE